MKRIFLVIVLACLKQRDAGFIAPENYDEAYRLVIVGTAVFVERWFSTRSLRSGLVSHMIR